MSISNNMDNTISITTIGEVPIDNLKNGLDILN